MCDIIGTLSCVSLLVYKYPNTQLAAFIGWVENAIELIFYQFTVSILIRSDESVIGSLTD